MASRIAGAVDDSAPLSSSKTSAEEALHNSKDSLKKGDSSERCSKSSKRKAANSTNNDSNDDQPSGDCPFFFEDEIFKIDRKGRVKFGVVTETPEGYSDDEEENYEDKLTRNEVRVAYYPDGKELVQQQKNIGLADRTLLPGDIVRRLAPNRRSSIGQCGYVRSINMFADVKVLGSKYVIKRIPCERLKIVSLWSHDTMVCLDSWVGNTTSVKERAILRGPNGSRVEIGSSDFYKFKDLQTACVRDVFNPAIFYPGNVVVGRLPPLNRIKNLTVDISLPTNKKGRALSSRYTIESVEIESVRVEWQCKALSKETNNDPEPIQHPDEVVKGEQLKNLKRLSIFESCMLQLHDRSYLKYSKCDKLIKYSDWEEEQGKVYSDIFKEQHKYSNLKMDKCEAPHDETMQASPSSASSTSKFRLRKLLGKQLGMRHSATQAAHNEPKQSKNTTAVFDPEQSEESSNDDGDESEEIETENENAVINLSQTADSTPTAKPTITTPTPVTATLLPRLVTRHAKRRQVKKKIRNIKKSLTAPFLRKNIEPKDGEELVVETLLVYSTADIVWQDGTSEENISSTQLYPLYTLDNHEFFPGDFVCSNRDDMQPCHRDYGVIQQVDYEGRTAHVKWYQTYVNIDNPVPPYIGQSEVSVYDLKDHPDFQYRPGTMVIRVANFTGEDANSTAGQIIDNCPDGRIKVWWVNGHISYCYPQDLFEISQYDQENEYAESGDDSDDSWETESEKSGFGSDDGSEDSIVNDTHVLYGIDNARKAIKRLEEIFRLTQTQPKIKVKVMQDLLSIYKNCRYLDRLLHTSFFEEEHFQGLVRLKKGDMNAAANDGTSTTVPENSTSSPANSSKSQTTPGSNIKKSKGFSPKVLFNAATWTLLSSKPSGNQAEVEPNAPMTPTNIMKRKTLVNEELEPDNQRRKNNDLSTTSINITRPGEVVSQNEATVVPESENDEKLLKQNETVVETAKPNEIAAENEALKSSGTAAMVAAAPVNGAVDVETVKTNLKSNSSKLVNANETPKTNEVANVSETTNESVNSSSAPNETNAVASIETPIAKPMSANDTKVVVDEEVLKTQQDLIVRYKNEYFDLLNSENANISKAFLKTIKKRSSKNDSGNYTRTENGDESIFSLKKGYGSAADMKTSPMNSNTSVEITELCTPDLCEVFCFLLNEQMDKCRQLIEDTYCKAKKLHEKQLELDELADKSDVSSACSTVELDLEEEDVVANAEETENVDSELPSIQEGPIASSSPTQAKHSDATKIPSGEHSAKPAVKPINEHCFEVICKAPSSHRYYSPPMLPANRSQYTRAIHREFNMLQNSLPLGVSVCAFEDRMDLLSAMMKGPINTPYEDALFFFDIQMPRDYPKSPPLCQYISFCTDRLNPNLYEEGKVCVSLLGTWSGRDTEVWGPGSTLLQVFVSIQGLILVDEPYFNEAGYEKQRGTPRGIENSRMYNEMAVIKVVQSTIKQIHSPPEIFKTETLKHFKDHGIKMHDRIRKWIEISDELRKQKITDMKNLPENYKQKDKLPPFPLLPCSRGCCIALTSNLDILKTKLDALNVEMDFADSKDVDSTAEIAPVSQPTTATTVDSVDSKQTMATTTAETITATTTPTDITPTTTETPQTEAATEETIPPTVEASNPEATATNKTTMATVAIAPRATPED